MKARALEMIVRLGDGLERRLGGNTQYLLGKRYRRQGRFAEALSAFQRAEEWLAQELGPDHAYVVAAVVMEAYCDARMNNLDGACRNYDRALAAMDRIGEHDHELARQIREYVATVCG